MTIARIFVILAAAAVIPLSASGGQCDTPSTKPAASTPAKTAASTPAAAAPIPAGFPTAAAAAAAIAALSDKDRKEMESEQKQGADVADQLEKQGKLSKDLALIDRVNTIGQKIAAIANTVQIPAQFGNNRIYPFTWTFHVVDDDDVNAFSLPGGFVYVNKGLLKIIGSDDELAGVLGHEITHAAHHHVATMAHEQSKMSAEMAIGLIAAVLAHASGAALGEVAETGELTQLGVMNEYFSKPAECDADHGGVIYMQKAGYNPIAMLTFMEKLQELEHRSVDVEVGILQDHPYTDERIVNIQAELASMGIQPTAGQMDALWNKGDQFASQGTGASRQIVFQTTVCATLHDPDGARSTALLKMLNAALAKGLQFGDVSASEDTIFIQSRPWLTVLPVDIAGTPGATTQSMAGDIKHSLQMVLYKRSFLSLNTISGGSD